MASVRGSLEGSFFFYHVRATREVFGGGGVCAAQAVKKGRPLFFLRLASSDGPKFLAFSKKSNDVVKPFPLEIMKNEQSNSIKKDRNKNRNIF